MIRDFKPSLLENSPEKTRTTQKEANGLAPRVHGIFGNKYKS